MVVKYHKVIETGLGHGASYVSVYPSGVLKDLSEMEFVADINTGI